MCSLLSRLRLGQRPRPLGDGKMAIKLFSCRDLDLPHDEMVTLRHADKLQLGIKNDLAAKLSVEGIKPTKTTAHAAYTFWNLVGLSCLALGLWWAS